MHCTQDKTNEKKNEKKMYQESRSFCCCYGVSGFA